MDEPRRCLWSRSPRPELLGRQLAVPDRVEAPNTLRHLAVGDAVHLERVQAG